jgi:BAG domain
MYVVPDSHVTVQPLAPPVERAISHRDYTLLQQLLQKEKQEKEVQLREQLKQQYAVQEQKQLELALYRLDYWQALARQRREEQIQRAVQAYRQKQLICAVEEQVYRRKIAEALEQRQNEMLRSRYLQNARAQLAQRQSQSPRLVAYPKLERSFDDYKAKHMCNVLRHCFANEKWEQEAVEDDGNPDWVDESDDEEDDDEQALQQSLWNRLSMAEEPEEMEDEDKHGGSQGAFTLRGLSQNMPQVSPQASATRNYFQEEKQPELKAAEPVAEAEQEPTAPDGLPTYRQARADQVYNFEDTPIASDEQSYAPNDQYLKEQEFNQEQALQDFLRQLMQRRKGGNDERVFAYNEAEPSKQQPEQRKQQQPPTILEPSAKTTHLGGYIPEDIITEAEPTPANEFEEGDVMTQDASDMVPPQVAVPPEPLTEEEGEEDVVDEMAKQAQLDKLTAIERKLDEVKHTHASEPIGPLSFDTTTKRKTLPATTKANKEFLRREEELVQLLLQLDAVDSMGQADIRNRRKHAVATAEKLLEALDDYKSTSA